MADKQNETAQDKSVEETPKKKRGRKPKAESNKVDFSNVSQSVKRVGFKCEKDHGGLVKGKLYKVSENIAEILELKGLGVKCDI